MYGSIVIVKSPQQRDVGFSVRSNQVVWQHFVQLRSLMAPINHDGDSCNVKLGLTKWQSNQGVSPMWVYTSCSSGEMQIWVRILLQTVHVSCIFLP